jgi:hypothetical protein
LSNLDLAENWKEAVALALDFSGFLTRQHNKGHLLPDDNAVLEAGSFPNTRLSLGDLTNIVSMILEYSDGKKFR